MSIDSRASRFRLLVTLGVLLVTGSAFVWLTRGWDVYGWRYGEPVQVKVTSTSCEYLVESGELTDCVGTWITADGTTHTGQIEGKASSVMFDNGVVPRRAWGEAVYAEPDGGWYTGLGLVSPFTFGAGLIALVAGIPFRPRKRDWEQARSGPLEPGLVARARELGLGAEQVRYWKKSSARRGVFAFADGCVVDLPPVVRAFRWDQVVAVFEHAYRDDLSRVRHKYLVRLHDETLTLDEAWVLDWPGLAETVPRQVNQRLLPKILAVLRDGGTYRFPMLTEGVDIHLSHTGVSSPRTGEFAWTDLTGADVKDGLLLIHGKQTMQCPWRSIGNPSLLLTILNSVTTGGLNPAGWGAQETSS